MYDPLNTINVLMEVMDHRAWQAERYHDVNQTMPDGTGPDVQWMPGLPYDAATLETIIRQDWDYDRDPDPKQQTWLRLLREEVAEAFASPDVAKLRAELIQVAAVAVSWIEKIDASEGVLESKNCPVCGNPKSHWSNDHTFTEGV